MSEKSNSILLRTTLDQRKRLKIAAASEDKSYIELIMSLLDERDAKLARRAAAQPSPLHRVGV